jgi:hypothetical protein
MGTQREEVIISVGVEQKSIEGELQSLRDKFHAFGQGVKGIFTSVFGQMGAERVVEKILSGMSAAMEKAKQIKATAFAQGTSTDFVQDIQNVGKAAGVSGEEIETMMNRFIKGLPAGSDVEQSFFAMADRLAGIEDPAERARVAIEAFGKSGIEMVKIAGHGSVAIKDLAARFDKLDEAELAELEHAKARLEKAGNWFTVFSGKMLMGFSMMGRWAKKGGPWYGEATDAGAEMYLEEMKQDDAKKAALQLSREIEQTKILAEHNEKIAEAREQIKKATAEAGTTYDKYLYAVNRAAAIESEIAAAKGDELAQDKMQLDLIDEKAKAEKLRLEMGTEADKKKKDALLLEKEILKNNVALAKDMFNIITGSVLGTINRNLKAAGLMRKKEDEFNPSLDEMADTSNPYNRVAWQLRQNMQWAHFDKLHGNTDAFQGDLQRIQSLRDTLTKAGVYNDPNRALIDEMNALWNPSENGGGVQVKLPFG